MAFRMDQYTSYVYSYSSLVCSVWCVVLVQSNENEIKREEKKGEEGHYQSTITIHFKALVLLLLFSFVSLSFLFNLNQGHSCEAYDSW